MKALRKENLETWADLHHPRMQVKGINLDLDHEVASRNKAERDRAYNTVQVPGLRFVGMLGLIGLILAHNRYLTEGGIVWTELTTPAYIIAGYTLVSSLALRLLYAKLKPLNLGSVFLNLDVLMLTLAVYCTGANESWLFFLPLVRVADQNSMGFKWSVWYTHFGLACYAGMLYYCVRYDGVQINWQTEGAKIALIYVPCIYITATALAAQKMRNRTAAAIYLARDLILRLKSKSDELRSSSQKAEEASRTKGMFLANMSHEIRTPMNGIIGMTDLALQTDLTADQKDYLTTVQTSAKSLLRIINDVLDFSKVEAGKLDFESYPFSLRESIGSALRGIAVRADGKGLEVISSIDPEVPDSLLGDPVRLGQVITNLAGNSVKFTKTGEVIVQVELTSRKANSAMLRFSVIDTGIGISEDQKAKVFQAFTQADEANDRKYGGTGLGLAISNQLVTEMGGRLRLESEAGKGSVFSFCVSFPVEAPAEATSGAELVALAGVRALVIVGHPKSAFEIVRMLDSWGMNARPARDTRVALEVVLRGGDASDAFDIVLVDTKQLAEGHRRFERICATLGPDTPVIALAGATEHPEEILEKRGLSIKKALVKPIIGRELRSTLLELRSPVSTYESASRPKPKQRTVAATPKTILLAEDNPVNQKLACILLKKWGHTVELANNGREAVELSETEQFDLILMDVQMPEMDGYTATRTIRDRELGTGIRTPIVAMTANAMEGDEQRCLDSGMDGYVPKPVDAGKLFAMIEDMATKFKLAS